MHLGIINNHYHLCRNFCCDFRVKGAAEAVIIVIIVVTVAALCATEREEDR